MIHIPLQILAQYTELADLINLSKVNKNFKRSVYNLKPFEVTIGNNIQYGLLLQQTFKNVQLILDSVHNLTNNDILKLTNVVAVTVYHNTYITHKGLEQLPNLRSLTGL